MFGIKFVTNAMANFAASLVELTSTVKQINGGLRERLGLDLVDQEAPLQLPEPEPVASNGKRKKLSTAASE